MGYYHAGKKERKYISKNEYLGYIASAKWKKIAEERRKIDNYTCQLCQKHTRHLEVHHLTYFSLKSENPYTDLVSLCPNCHQKVHKMMCRVTDKSGRRGWETLPYIQKINK